MLECRPLSQLLRELDLGGLTYYESKGRGEIPTPVIHGGRGTSVFRPEFNVNVTISIVVRDPIADNVVGKILESTSHRSCWGRKDLHI